MNGRLSNLMFCFDLRHAGLIVMVMTIQHKIKTFFDERTGVGLFFICSIVLTIIMGVVFRSQGYFNGNISLWLDEAYWAFRFSDLPLLKNAAMRPIGFIVATKLLTAIANNEITLRLIPYSASVLSIPLIYFIAREIFTSKLTSLLAVFIVSFNPVFIHFAKEFKPYSLELFLHMLLLYLSLRYIKLKTTPLFYLLLFVAAVTLLFAYNIVFLYPSIFLIALFDTYSEKKFQRFFFLLMTAFLLLGILLYAFYYSLWSSWDIASTKIYWGKKYDVFFLSSSFPDHAQWIFKKYLSLVQSSGTASIFWDLKFNGYSIIKVALWAFHCMGLTMFVVRRKWEYVLLFVVPIAIIIVCNIMGLWLFGAFRVNIFMFCYFILISLYGMDAAISMGNKYSKLAITSLIITIFIVLQLPFEISHYTMKGQIVSVPGYWAPNSRIRYVLDTISNYELSKNATTKQNEECIVLADGHSFDPVKYYLWKHSSLSKKYEHLYSNGKLRLEHIQGPHRIIKKLNKITADPSLAGKRVWIIISEYRSINKVDLLFSKKKNIILRKNFNGANLLLYYQI